MFGTIRKHQTWLWGVIITLTIISFVIFFSPYSKLNTDAVRRGDYGSINGQKVTEEAYAQAQREVYVRYLLMTGTWPNEDAERRGFDPMRETYQWLLLKQKAAQMGIDPDPDAVAQQARQMLQPFKEMKVDSPAVFIKQVLEPKGFRAEDLERCARSTLALQELIAVVGVTGKLVTPEEAKSLYTREHEQVATEAVFFSASNYLDKVTVKPEAVAQFYSNRLAVYRIPERVQVAYVRFNPSNYLAQAETLLGATNINEQVETAMIRLGTNFYGGAKTPEESKANIRREIIRQQALIEARKAAIEFARPLFESESPKAESLAQAAKEKGLAVEVTPPFSRNEGPPGLEVGTEFAQAAFALSEAEPLSRLVLSDSGVYLLALNKRLPSEVPPLDQIRERVTQDYKLSEALNLARQAGQAFHTTLTNGLAAGRSFAALAEAAGYKAVALPPFSLSTRSLPEVEEHLSLNQLKQMAFGTPPGKVSNFQPTQEGGAILFVKAKLPVDPATMQKELPGFVNYVRRTRQEEAFNDWFRKEAERGLRDTPLNRPQPPPPNLQKDTATS
jgi:peptidyl-prolyl cis-trans isomerase D